MKKIAVVLAIVVVLLCGVGYMVYSKGKAAAEALKSADKGVATVTRTDLVSKVVDTGTIDAVKSVEVKSRASGQLKKLYVDEGDVVTEGQLIAVIDPQETELKVRQDQAQLRGAQSSVARATIEIAQRRVTARENLRQSEIRLAQLRAELGAQPTLTSAAIRTAQSSLESANNELERLDRTAHPNQRIAIATALREAEANFNNAKAEYERQAELQRQGYVAQKVVENASLSLELARVRLQQARENSARLEAQLRNERDTAVEARRRAQFELERSKANGIQNLVKRKDYENAIADVEKNRVALGDVDALIQGRIQSQSSVDQLKSVLEDSQRQLRYTQVRSPLAGVVTKKLVQEGELVAALSAFSSGTTILRIEDRKALRVKLSINEIDVARIVKNMAAKITVDAIPNMTFEGHVQKIAPASVAIGNTASGGAINTDTVVKFDVEIWLDKVDPRLRSGMSAKCTLETARRDKALVLPAEYVGKDDKGRYVQIPSKDPKAKPEKKYVKIGLETGAMVEILDTLKEGDKVARPDFTGPARTGFMQAGPDNQ